MVLVCRGDFVFTGPAPSAAPRLARLVGAGWTSIAGCGARAAFDRRGGCADIAKRCRRALLQERPRPIGRPQCRVGPEDAAGRVVHLDSPSLPGGLAREPELRPGSSSDVPAAGCSCHSAVLPHVLGRQLDRISAPGHRRMAGPERRAVSPGGQTPGALEFSMTEFDAKETRMLPTAHDTSN